ncbi:hypothetical protein C0993_003537, partial [Termitomyces sp. T159_Od127]
MIRARSEAGQKFVDETVEGLRSLSELVQVLKDSGFRPEEAGDFIDAARRRIEIRQAKTRAVSIPSRPQSPPAPTNLDRSSTLSDPSGDQTLAQDHARAVESATWAVLQAQAHQSAEPSGPLSTSQVAKENLPCNETNETSESSAIPPSLLAVAPHLANLQAHASIDPYLAKTWELRQ